MSPENQGLVLAARFTSMMEAEIARVHLAERDIESVILGETSAGWRPEMSTAFGVELRVAPQDLAAARQLLEAVLQARRAKPS